MTPILRRTYWLPVLLLAALLPGRAAAQRIIWGYNPDLYGLHGAAAVIRAQGQYAKDIMTAARIREKARQDRIDTRRKAIEQMLWERENVPTTEDERQRLIKEAEKRAANTPPPSDIWTGTALNRLLEGLQKVSSDVLLSDTTALEPAMVAKLNVNVGFTSANIGLVRQFRARSALPWPLALQRDEFESHRREAEASLKQLIDAVLANRPIVQAHDALERRIDDMRRTVVAQQKSLAITFRDSVAAYEFLRELDEALIAMRKRDAADYLKTYVADGKTAGELIHHMKSHGLKFSRATPGDEAAYNAIHAAIAELYRKHVDNPIK